MTDHADTIRRYLWNTIPGQWPPVRIDEAHDALDALLSELRQAQDERDAAQRIIDEELSAVNRRFSELRHNHQQAIDALREIATPGAKLTSNVAEWMQNKARAALVKLGEQP